jgi:uncharacterized protein YkwD
MQAGVKQDSFLESLALAGFEESPVEALPPAAPIETVVPEPTVEPTATPRPPALATATRIPATATSAPRPPQAPVSTDSLSGIDLELFNSHNAERAKGGLAPLRIDAALVSVARQRANDMASKNYFSHTSPSGETAFILLNRSGYAYATAGENIARNNYPEAQSASVAMNGFMNSPSHRVNVMDPKFRSIGIASVTASGGMKYIAVIFSG